MISTLRKISLTQWILVAMVIGTFVGWLLPEQAQYLKPLSNIFLRMIKSLIAPLIFSTLVIGIAGHGDDMKRVGRLALKSIIYFEIVTTLALFIGLGAVNLAQPGVGVKQIDPEKKAEEEAGKLRKDPIKFNEVLEHTVPTSIFHAASENEVLQIVFWSVMFGAALTQVRGKPQEFMLHGMEALAETMFKFTGIVMKYAPIGIGAAIAVTVGHSGIGILLNLLKLILTLYLALFVFMVMVLLPAAMLTRIPLRKFGKAIKEPALIAFSTTSSEAALPKAMQAMQAIGVPKRVVAFVMPTGYSFNLDGTTLYLAVASIFACQVIGKEMSFGEQLIMMFTLMLTSKGVAGVPRASLVILSGTLASSAHLEPQQVALVLGLIMGVDELMDMARTTVNLIGNCLASCIMARWEGEFDDNATGILEEEKPAATPQTVAPPRAK
ncbi:dicarboxylate/amino acid:cation symporter [Zavarzinella formosa]|uniref:dicarboxylate/amino acid:cation symporter n=1 Tax=Zavarzinella formosa TaxID=360055 RepID=UPI000363B281|nr:dicarboxylate/amino acid:cation symporter [Zavarzinella formosa]